MAQTIRVVLTGASLVLQRVGPGQQRAHPWPRTSACPPVHTQPRLLEEGLLRRLPGLVSGWPCSHVEALYSVLRTLPFVV